MRMLLLSLGRLRSGGTMMIIIIIFPSWTSSSLGHDLGSPTKRPPRPGSGSVRSLVRLMLSLLSLLLLLLLSSSSSITPPPRSLAAAASWAATYGLLLGWCLTPHLPWPSASGLTATTTTTTTLGRSHRRGSGRWRPVAATQPPRRFDDSISTWPSSSSSDPPSSSSSSSRSTTTANDPDRATVSSWSLTDLLHTLDQYGIRYPPTAQRNQLEALLLRSPVPERAASAAPAEWNPPGSLPTWPLRGEPQEPRVGCPSPSNHTSSFTTSSTTSPSKTIDRDRASLRTWPLTDVLQSLDHHQYGVRYPPTANRDQLESLLRSCLERSQFLGEMMGTASSADQVPAVTPSTASPRWEPGPAREKEEKENFKARAKRAAQPRRPPRAGSPLNSPAEPDGRAARRQDRSSFTRLGAWQNLTRRARSWTRQLYDQWTLDDDGIRTVPFQYASRQREPLATVPSFRAAAQVHIDSDQAVEGADATATTIDVPAVPIQPNPRPRDKPEDELPADDVPRSGPDWAFSQRGPHSGRVRRRPRSPPRRLLLLPPSRDDGADGANRQRPRPATNQATAPERDGLSDHEDTRREGRRRIYSPYGDSSDQTKRPRDPPNSSSSRRPEPREDEPQDALDRLGSMLADLADRVLWGASSGAGDDDRQPAGKPSGGNDRRSGTFETVESEKRANRHWRDRLEERFDSLLGIHEEGESYDRWTTMTEQERKEAIRRANDFDVFDVAQGVRRQYRPPKASRRPEKKGPVALWEEEGNLVSLLIGRTPTGGNLFFEKLLDRDSGSVLNLFRATFKSILLVSSYVCRWASVRGALPQPLVVLGVVTAGLCAAPRRRLRAVVIALIVLRAAGELVHGYAQGEQGWDSSDDEECIMYWGDDEEPSSVAGRPKGQNMDSKRSKSMGSDAADDDRNLSE